MTDKRLGRTNATGADFDPFAEGEVALAFASSDIQQAIWASVELGKSDAVRAYNESVRIHLRGPLDVTAFEGAFAELVRRHEALRASFSPDGLTVVVSSTGSLKLEVEDISTRNPSAQAARLGEIARDQALHIFDLVHGPLCRAWLVRLSENEHWFYFTGHHLVCDGWSIAVVLYELGVLYSNALGATSTDLPPADRMSEYVAQERAFVGTPEHAAVEAFWAEHFRDGVPSFEVPTDFPRPPVRGFGAERLDLLFDAALIQQAKQLGQRNRSSLVVTLAASFAAYLGRILPEPEFVLAVPAAGQAAVGAEYLIGHCVNVMPIRVRFDPAQSFAAFLADFRKSFMDAFDHQQVTLGELIRLLRIPREPDRIPLVPVTFNVDTGMDNFDFAGLEATYHSTPKQFGDFEITINAAQLRDRFQVECTYSTGLYAGASITRRMREWETFLRGVVADPEAALGVQPLLEPAAREQILVDWNQASAPIAPACLHQLVEAQVDRDPAHTAIVFRGAVTSYGDLDSQANQIAHLLLERGAGPESMVAVLVERSPRMVAAALGAMKAGAAYVPIDPAYPEDRIAFMLDDIGASIVITEQSLRSVVPATPASILDLDADRAHLESAPKSRPTVAVTPENLAYVIYTSGSTGKPKGVLTPHRAAANYVGSMGIDPGVDAKDVVLAAASLSFDMSVFDIWVPLTHGATCVVLSRDETLDGNVIGRVLIDQRVTLNMLTPVSWQMILDSGWPGSPRLRAMSGGEELSRDLAARLSAKVKAVYNVYGPTETTVLSHFSRVEDPSAPITIGRPLRNVRAYILDPRQQPVPVGIPGELCIGGAQVARGYHRRPELTREKFVTDPFVPDPGARLYRSGDLARWHDDGSVEWLGRIDGQVKIRGYRIELGEIEACLRRTDGVDRAVVHAHVIDGAKTLVAYVVPRAGARLEETALRNGLRGSLPAYMLPAHILVLDSFPVSPTGKIDRRALPLPGARSAAAGDVGGDAPRTPVEEVLMDVWEEVIGKRPRRGDNFFDLGGHSLQAMRVIEGATLRGLSLSPAQMFQFPTLAELARAAELRSTAEGGEGGVLVPLRDKGTRPPLYFLHSVPGDLLHYGPLVQRLGSDQPCYGFQCMGIAPGRLREWTLERLAAEYVTELMRFQPHGPYHLVGWCFGGNLAVEMAQQLRARGERVGFVGLMESWPVRSREQEALHKAKQLVKMGRRALPQLRQKAKAALSGEHAKDPLEVFALDMDSGPFRNRNEIYRKNTEALTHYRSRFYPGSIWLFEARDKPSGAIEDPNYGWRDFAQRVVSVGVAGAHEDMLKSPHVDALAAAMRAAVDDGTRL